MIPLKRLLSLVALYRIDHPYRQRFDMFCHLYFIDLTKAFDKVNCSAFWAILSNPGCSPRFIQIIHSFHDGMVGRIIEIGDAFNSFPVSNDVKQGCVCAPTLFSLLFTQMLSVALCVSLV